MMGDHREDFPGCCAAGYVVAQAPMLNGSGGLGVRGGAGNKCATPGRRSPDTYAKENQPRWADEGRSPKIEREGLISSSRTTLGEAEHVQGADRTNRAHRRANLGHGSPRAGDWQYC